MKKLLCISIAMIALMSCSNDEGDNSPNVSFTVETLNPVASQTIIVTNTTTNYDGGFNWEVTSPSGTQTYITEDITFTASRVADYIINLKAISIGSESQQVVNVRLPSRIAFKNVTLQEIPQSYDALYFKIVRSRIDTEEVVYTSEELVNISSTNASDFSWDIDLAVTSFAIENDPASNPDQSFNYKLNFYDSNYDFVTNIFLPGNVVDETGEFVSGEKPFSTSTLSCPDCPIFTARVDVDFTN